MLKNCKISEYKIKKILKCFSEDSTSTEAAQVTRLNRKTTDRYYNLFRETILQIVIDSLKTRAGLGEDIGYVKGEYGNKGHYKIYKMDEKTFLAANVLEKPKKAKDATKNKEFNKYLGFVYSRFQKFNGFTEQAHHYQLFESMIKYSHTPEALFKLIWKNLKNNRLQP